MTNNSHEFVPPFTLYLKGENDQNPPGYGHVISEPVPVLSNLCYCYSKGNGKGAEF